jgi:DNA primase catalytic core
MNSQLNPDPQRLIAAHEMANEFYRSHLLDEPRALTYLRSRGIVAATAHAAPWTIGYAPLGWTALREHLRAAGFSDPELLAAGLVTTARTGNLIDVFRDRVTFPIRNRDGQVVAFTGRDLSGRDGTPKYRNTTTTVIYQKKAMLYGLAEQFNTATRPAAVMLVEGPADVVAIDQLRHSLPANVYPEPYYAVAPCGTALTGEQVTLLAAAVPPGTPIVSGFDADTAGQEAIDKSYDLLRAWPGPVEAMALPAGSDPASLVASGPANAARSFAQVRTPLIDLVIEHRLTPHLTRLDTRLAELARFGRDPASESVQIRLDALHALAPLLTDVASRDTAEAARLAHQLTLRLDLNPLTVFEAIYPPTDTGRIDLGPGDVPGKADAGPIEAEPAGSDQRPATPMGAAGFPDPQLVGHEYARIPAGQAPAATWVQHNPATGHSAWVIAEGVADTAADRDAARLACEVAGRVAVLVGAHKAVDIARTAVNAHFAQLGRAEQGNATIAVLTSFDGDRPVPGQGRFSVAWAGDSRVYATTERWFAALTVDHTLRARAIRADPGALVRDGDGALTASVRGGPIGINRIDLPVTQILLAGRALCATEPGRLREALDGRRPSAAIGELGRLGGPSAVALVVRPRPDRARDVMTAARLARQDRAPADAPSRALQHVRGRPRQAALSASSTARTPAR